MIPLRHGFLPTRSFVKKREKKKKEYYVLVFFLNVSIDRSALRVDYGVQTNKK